MLEGLLLGTFIGLQTIDTGTTCYALSTGRFVEANMLMPSTCPKIALVKAGITGGAVLWGRRMDSRKGKIVYYAILAGVSVYPVVHNIRALRP